tara:strand:- start:60287 stop:62581 length:2295 start_codon:yes stop_codon:yes gene_type:complete
MRSRAVGVGLSLLLLGCGSNDESKGNAASKSGENNAAKGKAEAKKIPSARIDARVWRALLNEALRAELDVNGSVVNFGTSDQHKYTRGGWATGWGDSGSAEDGTQFAKTDGKASKLNFWFRQVPLELVLRARTAGGAGSPAKVSASIGKTSIAKDLLVTSEWQVVRAPIKGAETGRHTLSLQSSTPIELDWLWLPTIDTTADLTNVPRALPVNFANGSRRALAAPTSRAISFFLHVPKGAKLIVDVGSDQEATFKVTAHTESGTEELLRVTPQKDAWQEQVIDLSKYASMPIRLELSTESEPGKTGWGEPEIVVAKAPEAPAPAKRAKNLVYVVMDTTRADSFASVKPNTDVHTPAYDALAAKSTTFANAYNNENWTKPSVTTMWSSLYPGTHGAREATSHVDESIRFLPQQLEDNGFTTGAFIANAVVSKTFGFDKGWSHFQNDSDHSKNGNGSMLYPHAAEWMEKHKDERFFLYVQSVDPHTTYDVPKDYWSRYYDGGYNGPIGTSFDREEQMVVDNGKMKISAADLKYIWALYKGEVTYQDHYLGGLLKKIEELGLSDDTLIVLTNDHGEEIQEHGGLGHGWPLFEEQIRAPLLMSYAPMFSPGANVKEIVEHVDLAPTILDALGVKPMQGAEGLSFLPFLEDGVGKRQHPFTAIAWTRKGMRSIRVGDWKLITGKSSGWMYLFNLKDDPEELASLVKKGKTPPSQALLPGRLCDIYLGEALATHDKAKRLQGAGQRQRYNSPEIPIDDKTRKELEALGYL